jgi:hypothetical protein
VLIKPTDDLAESPLEVVRLPLSVPTRVYDHSNPPTAEGETHRETPINAGIALPLLLEFDLVNWIAQFRNEPLHLGSRFSCFFQDETMPASVYRRQGSGFGCTINWDRLANTTDLAGEAGIVLGGNAGMKNIFVGNLSFSATEDMLRSLFEKYGGFRAGQ